MKKVFNLSVILAVLMAAFTFSSCNENEGNITVVIDAPSFAVGAFITGSITSDNKIEVVRIEVKENGIWQLEERIPRNNFAAWGITEINSGDITLRIPGTFAAGEYTIQAIDNKDNESRKIGFTITGGGTGPVGVEISTFTSVRIANTLADGTSSSCAASVDGTIFSPASASAAQRAKCDFVYFTGRMHSPHSASTAQYISDLFTSWSVKNDTKFRVLSGVDFATVTGENIIALAGNPTDASVVVSNGSVVAFKTVGGEIGIFHVTEFNSSGAAAGFCRIDIKVEK